jgi:catechol 2,3-dioxygenase-like lactoylglutathione lyase family enzyme
VQPAPVVPRITPRVVNAVVMAPGKHIGARRGQPEDARRVGRMAIGGNRIYHVNSNCTDLERAARFYEALGLRRVIRTVPSRPQPGDAFGLAEVAWDAWVLQSEDGLEGLSLDLLEWTVPPPTGAPPSTAGQPGLNRLCMSTPDLDATVAAATAAGGTPGRALRCSETLMACRCSCSRARPPRSPR